MKSKIIKLFAAINILFAFIININCTEKNIRAADNEIMGGVKKAYAEHINIMVKQLSLYNKNSPSTISLSFVIIGSLKNKKFKSIGSLRYNKKELQMDASFLDYIFKSPITKIYQNNNDINFYFPAGKKLVLDNINTIQLQNYLNLNIPFNILYELFAGKIPLIKNYFVRQGLSSKKGNGSYLILENSKFFETISFHKGKPDKILIINKYTKEKFEIYLNKHVKKNGTHFFRQLKVIARQSKIKFYFYFNNIRLNKPVKVKTIKDLRLPGRVKIIKM